MGKMKSRALECGHSPLSADLGRKLKGAALRASGPKEREGPTQKFGSDHVCVALIMVRTARLPFSSSSSYLSM